jgi:hypothetical protein
VRRLDPRTLLPSIGIAIGLVALGWGLSTGVTGRDAEHLPDAIERVEPVADATQAPRQTQVFVDFEPGYEAELTIDGTPLPTTDLDDIKAQAPQPGQQVAIPPTAIFDPGNVTISYRPSSAGPVHPFAPGIHHAEVVYWKAVEGRDHALSYAWSFTVV